jgi:hypothetical protein
MVYTVYSNIFQLLGALNIGRPRRVPSALMPKGANAVIMKFRFYNSTTHMHIYCDYYS